MNRPRPLRSLRNRLALMFLAITALGFAVVIFFFVPRLESRLEEQRVQDLEKVARTYSPELERVIGRTMEEAFPVVLRDPMEDENTLLVGAQRGSADHLRAMAGGLATELGTIADVEAARVGSALPGGEVYTDDRAPVEWLVDRSILGYAAGD